MFVVKRLGRNGMWNAVSLIDENGSFRGEAKFPTQEEAEVYLAIYLKRMKDRLRDNSSGELQVKVFDDSGQQIAEIKPEKPRKTRKAPKKRKKTRK